MIIYCSPWHHRTWTWFKTVANALVIGLFLWPLVARSQLVVTVSRPKLAGQKAVVPVAMKNEFAETIESARATLFLFNEQGKMEGQTTHWVIGGARTNSGLAPGATSVFHFVVTAATPFSTANVTPKLSFSRVVLEGGKQADLSKAVQLVTPGPR